MNLLHQIALTKINGIGPKMARHLLAYTCDIEEIFNYSKKNLLKIPGIGEHAANAIVQKKHFDEAEKELDFITKNDIKVLWIQDEHYPSRLKNCDDAPLLLYAKGNVTLNHSPVISIVGTRNSTSYGQRICEDLVKELKNINPLIISGLAHGIDILAHKNALLHHIPTIAVLGHGLDRIYPKEHAEIAQEMLHQGGLITEFSAHTIPERQNFPMRNRIIAGVADVTVVVEAAIKGGALITAEIANSYHRDVCAFPGSIHASRSQGTNYLIKSNRAHLIRDAQDLVQLMNWDYNIDLDPKSTRQLVLIPQTLNPEQLEVYVLISQHEQISIDQLSAELNWPLSKLAIILLELEMETRIVTLPGKIYKLIN